MIEDLMNSHSIFKLWLVALVFCVMYLVWVFIRPEGGNDED